MFSHPFKIFHDPFEQFGYPFEILNNLFKRSVEPVLNGLVTCLVAVRFTRLMESRFPVKGHKFLK